MPEVKKCLNPHCQTKGNENITSRGICRSCYSIVTRLIKQGKTTWDELAAAGYVTSGNKTRQLSEKAEWFLGAGQPVKPEQAKKGK